MRTKHVNDWPSRCWPLSEWHKHFSPALFTLPGFHFFIYFLYLWPRHNSIYTYIINVMKIHIPPINWSRAESYFTNVSLLASTLIPNDNLTSTGTSVFTGPRVGTPVGSGSRSSENLRCLLWTLQVCFQVQWDAYRAWPSKQIKLPSLRKPLRTSKNPPRT